MPIFSLLWLFAVSACEDTGSVRRVDFFVTVRGEDRAEAGPLRVVTPSGWSVTIEEALISIGPVYARNAPPTTGTAEDNGRVVTEVLAVTTIDALDPAPVDLDAVGLAVTERTLSAEIRLTEADEGPIADHAGAGRAVAWVRGTATREGRTVRFQGPLAFPPPISGSEYAYVLAHVVRRIPVDFTPRRGGRLTIAIDPTHWLDDVAFDALGPEGAEIRRFDSDASRTQFRTGLARTIGYRFTWQDAP